MASMAAISRRLSISLLSNAKASLHYELRSMNYCTNNISFPVASNINDSNLDSVSDSDSDSVTHPSPPLPSSSKEPNYTRIVYDRPLENGLDSGIYKAILVGQVGQSPLQKQLKSGQTVTLFSIGTGGIRNNRKPLANEEPKEYANRCAVQWHRVSVYPQRLGEVVVKHAVPGSILYLEGNLETKIFTDPITGLVRRIREIAIRRNGRLVFLGNGGDAQKPAQPEFRGVGYY